VTLLVLGLGGAAAFLLVTSRPGASSSEPRSGGVLRVSLRPADVDSLDPALAYGVSWYLLDATCARLMTSGPSHGSGPALVPEVAAGRPRVTNGGKTYVFTVRDDVRFSDGSPVRADAFARAIERTLAPDVESPWAAYTRDFARTEARGNTLVLRLKRPVPEDELLARMSFLCAVPPALPADPEGMAVFPAAGPYYVADYVPNERVVLRRNPFYDGARPHRVDGFDVDLGASSPEEVLDRIERGEADWGWAPPPTYFAPGRRLAEKYGVNRSQFFVRPGPELRGFVLNSSRPLFRDNPRLRQAVNLAVDRSAFHRVSGGPLVGRLTDQYLPPTMAGFADARIYPLTRPDVRRARALARGHLRGGKALLYTVDAPQHLALAQSIRQDLAKIGLEVRIKGIPLPAYFGRLGAQGPYDIGFMPWLPDYADPYGVLNILFDGQFIGSTNWARFDSPEYNRLLRRAAGLSGPARLEAYGELDAHIARDAAPMIALAYLNEPVLVSKRVGCVGEAFDLAALCLD
jgi:peptide/nickel transport system substrate-binding protein